MRRDLIADERPDRGRELGGPVQHHERCRILDLSQPRVRDRPGEPAGVVDREEAIVDSPREQCPDLQGGQTLAGAARVSRGSAERMNCQPSRLTPLSRTGSANERQQRVVDGAAGERPEGER